MSNTPFPLSYFDFLFNVTHWIYLCLLAWASVGSSLLSVNRRCTIALKKMINPSPEPRNCVSPLSERCSLRVLCALHDGQCTMVSRFSAGPHSYMEGVYECCSLARPWRHHFTDPLHPLALSFLLPCLCSLSSREGNVPFRAVHWHSPLFFALWHLGVFTLLLPTAKGRLSEGGWEQRQSGNGFRMQFDAESS